MSLNKGKAKVSTARTAGTKKKAVMNRRKYNEAISGDTMSNYGMYKKGGKVKKYQVGKEVRTAVSMYGTNRVPAGKNSTRLFNKSYKLADKAESKGYDSESNSNSSNAERIQKRADRVYDRGIKARANEIRSADPAFKAAFPNNKKKGGAAHKYKSGGSKFPDLTGDGKVTRADILKGRGVFKKGGTKIKKFQSAGIITKSQGTSDPSSPSNYTSATPVTRGSRRLEKKIAKEKQKQEIYNIQGYKNKSEKSDAQAERAAKIIKRGNRVKNKGNTTMVNATQSSNQLSNQSSNQSTNTNQSGSQSSANARGGSGGSSNTKVVGGNDFSTNANRSSNVSGGAQNRAEQNVNSKNYKKIGGKTQSIEKIMKNKMTKKQFGGNKTSSTRTTKTTTNVDNSNKNTSSNRSNNVIGGSNNRGEQNVGSKNTRVTKSSNTNRSNVGNKSTNQRVSGYKKGGMTKKKK